MSNSIIDLIPEKYAPLLEKYDQNSFRNVVSTLANKLENSQSIEVAGKLVIAEVVRTAGSLSTYLKNLDHRLSSRVKSFLINNFDECSKLLTKYSYLNFYDHDFFSASTLTNNYLLRPDFKEDPVESPLQMYLGVAIHLFAEEGMKRVEKAFFEMAHHCYTHASPTFFNARTKKPQGSSCFLMELGDSLDGILTGVRDAGLISQHKGGLGIGLGQIRHSEISNAGMSSGVTPVARILDKMVGYVDQGGSRAGAGNVYLPIWHIDIVDFINSTNNFGQSQSIRLQQLNTSIWMHNLFFKRVSENGKWTVFCPAKAKLSGLYGIEFENEYVNYEELANKNEEEYKQSVEAYKQARNEQLANPDSEDVQNKTALALQRKRVAKRDRIDHITYNARDILSMISDVEIKSGFPFIMNGDEVNMKTNQANIGKINNSNLCVSGETPVLTREYAYVPIQSIEGKEVHIWNGDEWSKVKIVKTSDEEILVRVLFTNGMYIDCTRYHKFLIASGSDVSKFNPRDCLRVEAHRLRTGVRNIKYSTPVLRDEEEVGEDILNQSYNDGLNYQNVPLDKPFSQRKSWISGVIDNSSTQINRFEQNAAIIKSSNLQFLHFTQLLLTTFGINTSIKEVPSDFVKYVELPDPTRNGVLSFYRNTLSISSEKHWILIISIRDLASLVHYGVQSKCKKLDKIRPNDSDSNIGIPSLLRVCGVYETGRSEPVYCFKEEKNQAGVFAGVLTGNCTEICEVSTPESVASCNLASVSLRKFALKEGPKKLKDESENDFIKRIFESKSYDFNNLGSAVRSLVENLDAVITHNLYPVSAKTEELNLNTRPLGIGVSGFDDAVKIMDYLFDSEETVALNKAIFACMYFNALVSSINLARNKGEYKLYRYGSFKLPRSETEIFNGILPPIHSTKINGIVIEEFSGSPASNGFLQFDLWNRDAGVKQFKNELDEKVYNRHDDIPIDPKSWGQEYACLKSDGTILMSNSDISKCPTASYISPDWNDIRKHLISYGLRNSLLLTVMPTASTAQVLRNTESTEVHASNLYTRTVTSGHYILANPHLIKDLECINLWNEHTIEFLTTFYGSMVHFVKFVESFPLKYPNYDKVNNERLNYIVQKYKTMFEISQKTILKYSRQRAIYIDQSQSLNIYLEDPTISQVQAVHVMGNKLNLKTGLYYLRQKNDKTSAAFTISPEMLKYRQEILEKNEEFVIPKACPIDPVLRAECLSCQ